MDHLGKLLLLCFCIGLTSGCSSIGYYLQAISGHFDLTSREKPITGLLENGQLDEHIRGKLQLALQARAFASQELKLPDNDSYKNYADLERPYVVWTVVATPEFAVEPRQWCFLIVGCLSYRGYFAKQDAEEKLQELRQEGYDVSLAGTSAYSTLGYFDDPLLNTMLRQSEASMIGILFHELAHQQLHVDGDTAFNEAFATAVEQEGVRRWYQSHNEQQKYSIYISNKAQQQQVFGFMRDTRQELAEIYKQDISAQQKRLLKQAALQRLRLRYKAWQQASGYHGFDNWMQKDLNNAHLALIATYQDLVPNFLAMLASVNGDMAQFYVMAREIGDKQQERRQSMLASYLK